ncbi:nitroreductase [Nocardioides sp. J9]|uniref:nitroreductase family protein n=1 Tax=Nocardioides sp. J9 TaxID=935844 RepID=UPI00119E97EC|nr:nitroreductase family protein [Nocardioides sp. J9]TWG98558.1 nitroreductase [Nocardioides sp. J9]
MNEPIGLFEAISTTRAMRRLKPDPVPDDLIVQILQAGLCAPNGGNMQKWRFLVIKDEKIKRTVQQWYKKAYDEIVGPVYAQGNVPAGTTAAGYKKHTTAVEYLTEHLHEAPVWIIPCLEHRPKMGRAEPASIYPAVQNMLLAARALGLGATLTTRHLMYEEETERALGIPEGVRSWALIPIGYPLGKFGPVKRGELADFVDLDRWGQPYPAVEATRSVVES